MLNTHMTMAEAFFQMAQPRCKQLAMVCGEERYTYGQLMERTPAPGGWATGHRHPQRGSCGDTSFTRTGFCLPVLCPG